MAQTPYEIPDFVKESGVSQKAYKTWLDHKARAHEKRDSKRRPEKDISIEDYKKAIHEAVMLSGGIDAYTKERLAWDLISKYENTEAANQGLVYFKKFELLPTVDHEDSSARSASFKICGWRTNDCKSHLTLSELKEFCKKILDNNP